MAKKKTNEQFIADLKTANPKVVPLESYVNAVTRIRLKCKVCGYVWKGIPNNILRGEGCPACASNLQLTTAEFISRMHIVNPDIYILGEYKNNKTHIKYQCKKCGFIGEAVPSSLYKGHSCKQCGIIKASRKKTKSDEMFKEELNQKNPLIETLSPYQKSKAPITCRCRTCGYVFVASPEKLLAGKKCDQCNKHVSPLVKPNAVFLAELSENNPNVEALEPYKGAETKIMFKCKECGNEWKSNPRQLLRGQKCPTCQKRWHTSFPEQAIYYYLKQAFPDAINTYKIGFDRSELDIFLPSLQVGIEYDGKRWHEGKGCIETSKYRAAQEKNIFLIRIRESEDLSLARLTCDHVIYSAYGKTKKYTDLDACIKSLFDYLNCQQTINTKQDRLTITEQYYSRRQSNSLGVLYPEIAEEWYQPNNGRIQPSMVSPKSNEAYYWKCVKCGKVYQSTIINRVAGHGCSRCARVERKTETQFAEEMKDNNPNVEVCSKYISGSVKVQYYCHVCNGHGAASPRTLLKGNGCPNCHRKTTARKKALSPELFLSRARELYPDIDFTGDYKNSDSTIRCKCKKCGHIWFPRANSILSRNTGCAVCSDRNSKKVMCIDTGDIYDSIHSAEIITKISHSSISKCCNGKGITAGGYRWKFLNVKAL